ncbi:hypothetical protein [Moraxella oblonga]|uniref:hypothetical protein n=1 Tax=Moraxella oblonga TaxID=200413 RepID=UPI000830FF10|nr:hypothetical protein [Moraxella oblonga]
MTKPRSFDKTTLLEVRLAKGLHNPWGYGNQGGRLHAVYTHDHTFPVVLPPRYLENGYEWRAYESFNLGSNSLFWVGVPSNKHADYVYEVADDGKYYIKINIFPRDNPNAPLYEQRLALEEVSEHIIVNPNNYGDELNGVFANMADEKATEWGGGRYHFKSPSLSSLHPHIRPDDLVLGEGCQWQKTDRQDIYQWGKARINWQGRELKHAKTFCSDKLVAVAYLLERDEVGRDGQSKRVIDARLLVNVFDKETLTPFDGVYLETYIEHDLKDGLVAGTIDIKEIKVAKSGDEYRVIAKLSNGKTVQYQ